MNTKAKLPSSLIEAIHEVGINSDNDAAYIEVSIQGQPESFGIVFQEHMISPLIGAIALAGSMLSAKRLAAIGADPLTIQDQPVDVRAISAIPTTREGKPFIVLLVELPNGGQFRLALPGRQFDAMAKRAQKKSKAHMH